MRGVIRFPLERRTADMRFERPDEPARIIILPIIRIERYDAPEPASVSRRRPARKPKQS